MSQRIVLDPLGMLGDALEEASFPDGWTVEAYEILSGLRRLYIIVLTDPQGEKSDRTMGWTYSYLQTALRATLQEDIQTAIDDIRAFIEGPKLP